MADHLLKFSLEANSPWRAVDLTAVLGDGHISGRMHVSAR
jgi:hypothetical protein